MFNKKTWYKMFGFVLKMFIGLLSFSESLASMVNVSSLTTCITLTNQPCMAGPTFIDLNPNEYNQGFRYYPFMVN